ncbi:DUF695 domain-containing protein [Ferruginibacter sp.]
MSFLKKIFGSGNKQPVINTPGEFWDWFIKEEKSIFNAVKNQQNAMASLDKVIANLQQLNPGLFALLGMYDDATAELIITPDGDVKNIVFAEDIAKAAPQMAGWKITALKPAVPIADMSIDMYDMEFSSEKISFFAVNDAATPDEIEIHIVHKDYKKDFHKEIASGSLIYLDNLIGEILLATLVDDIYFDAPDEVTEELIPIKKLKDYLVWREKEFVEKYEYTRYESTSDELAIMEAKDKNDLPIIATVDQELLAWDAKASHPWILNIDIAYKGSATGMPDEKTLQVMYEFEDRLAEKLTAANGYLFLGRETYNNERTTYFACKEFRECSRIAHRLIKEQGNKLQLSYSIYKDKYWKTMNRYS